MLLRLDDDAFGSNSMIIRSSQAPFYLCTQRIAVLENETKPNGSCYFVDVLTTGALRSNCRELDVIHRDLNVIGDMYSVYHLSHTGVTLSGNAGNPPGRDHLLSG